MNKFTSTDSIVLGSNTMIIDPSYIKESTDGIRYKTVPGKYIVKEFINKMPEGYEEIEGVLIVHESQKSNIKVKDCKYKPNFIITSCDEIGVYDIEKYPNDGIKSCKHRISNCNSIYHVPDGNWGVTAANFDCVAFSVCPHKNENNKIDAIYLDFSEEY